MTIFKLPHSKVPWECCTMIGESSGFKIVTISFNRNLATVQSGPFSQMPPVVHYKIWYGILSMVTRGGGSRLCIGYSSQSLDQVAQLAEKQHKWKVALYTKHGSHLSVKVQEVDVFLHQLYKLGGEKSIHTKTWTETIWSPKLETNSHEMHTKKIPSVYTGVYTQYISAYILKWLFFLLTKEQVCVTNMVTKQLGDLYYSYTTLCCII